MCFYLNDLLFGLLLAPIRVVVSTMKANISFVYPSPPLLNRLFYVALSTQQVYRVSFYYAFTYTFPFFLAFAIFWNLQVEQLKQDGFLAAPDRCPYFPLREDAEPTNKRARGDEGRSTRSDVVLVELEFTMRGVCTMWPDMLQCDTMKRYRLRGSLYKQMTDCYGNPLYAILV